MANIASSVSRQFAKTLQKNQMEENKELDLSAIKTFNGGAIILYYEPTNEENEQRKTDNSRI